MASWGYDPWLHTEDQLRRLAEAVSKVDGELVALDDNPLDRLWQDQPPAPISPVVPQDLVHAGRSSGEKRADLAETLAKEGAEAMVITMTDSIAWLLNVRGGDVTHTPLSLSFAVLDDAGQLSWFIDSRKLPASLGEHLGNGVEVCPPEALGGALDGLGVKGKRVRVDKATAASWIFRRLKTAGAALVPGPDLCQLPKACKNQAELTGTRQAHLRDGAALTRFLAWFAEEAPRRAAGDTPEGQLGELEISEKLRGFRAEDPSFRDLSFDTIAGAGANGAIVHYRPAEESQRFLGLGDLLLLDSGAQYPDGTTDVTRTMAVGSPSAEMRDRFTRVLKGHIALGGARFPVGTTGSQLDSLARAALWQAGLDYDHGTGHGVGSYLGVHEGPQRISKMPSTVALKPGMIISNEPGYYKTGAYGIRIENLVAVTALPEDRGERPMLAFETLTLAPIDQSLIDPALLTAEEADWLDTYHARVRESLSPLLDAPTVRWLESVTRPLAQSLAAE